VGKYGSQRSRPGFLRQYLLSGEPFVLREFIKVTSWDKLGKYRTYCKRISRLNREYLGRKGAGEVEEEKEIDEAAQTYAAAEVDDAKEL